MSTLKQTKEIIAPDHKNIWVAFSGRTDIWWLKILKPEFRHCFIVMQDGKSWIIIDPMASMIDVQIYAAKQDEVDFPEWLTTQGFTVVSATIKTNHSRAAPFMLCSCVEITKRFLGVHCRRIITPWQLFKHLKKLEENSTEQTQNLTEQTQNLTKGYLSWVS